MKTIFKNIKIFPFCLCFLSSFVYAQAQQGSYNYTPATNAYNEGTTLIGKSLNGITPYVGNGTTDSRGVSSLPAPQPGSGGNGGGWCGYFFAARGWRNEINIPCEGLPIYKETGKYSSVLRCPSGYSLQTFIVVVYECTGSGYISFGNECDYIRNGYTCVKNY